MKMKIAVLNLNPGLDRIIYLNTPAKLNTLNRAEKVIVNQGSKGANVAIMLKTLGADPDYYTFTGGYMGKLLQSFTDKANVRSHFCQTEYGVRVNTKIIDSNHECTEFNECGGPVREAEIEMLADTLKTQDFDIVIMNGSLPKGAGKDTYARIIKHFADKNTRTVLDTDGEVMDIALVSRPSVIKPNRRELAGILKIPEESLNSYEKVLKYSREVKERYGCDVLCTLDSQGSVCCIGDKNYCVSATPVALKGFSGAGDAYLSTYIYKKYIQNMDNETALRYASAAAGAKVALEGTELPNIRQIESLLDLVNVTEM